MKSENKNREVADEIIDILRSGLTISTDTQHYIDSTFSNLSADAIATLLKDETNCEADSLIALLFFPDESMQLQLEEIIDGVIFEKHDERTIADMICSQVFHTRICLPDGRGSFEMTITPSNVAQFIEHLNLSRLLDSKLRSAIAQYVDQFLQTPCKVRLRNAKPISSPNHILFLVNFVRKWRRDPDEFLDCLDFILSFLAELEDDPDMFHALMAKKKFYFLSLQKARNLDIQRTKHNMETLLLKGKRMPYVDQADARKKIRIIDRISLAVFGKTEFFDWMPASEQSLTLSGKADIDKFIKELG